MSQERVGILIEVENFKNAEKQMHSLDDLMNELRKGLKLDVQMDTSNAVSQTKKLAREARSLKDVYNGVVVAVLHAGSAMQSMGNALTKLSNPFRSFMRSTVWAAGFKAFDAMSQGFSSGFDRYDTLKQYSLAMEEYATASYSVEQSQKDLVASVKGLPTGLDEIASLAQRYTLSLGDMQEGTDLAIATNNAFMASMATESQRYQGMMQLQDLLNGKDLNSREWMSLGSSMGKAINEIGKELGYGSDEMGEFRQELYAGHIATEDFLNALKKVGTGEGSIAKLAKNVKVTWGAVFSNIGNAFSRMTQGILETLDQLAEERWGKSLPIVIADQLDKIDAVTASMKQYVLDHKDTIFEFVDMFKSIDWKSIGQGFVEGLEIVGKGLRYVAKFFGGNGTNILRAYAKFVPIASVLGKFLTVGGGILKGSRHPFGWLGTGLYALFTGLLKLTGLKGFRKAPKALDTVGEVAEAAGRVNGRLPKIKTLMTGLKRNLIGLANFGISAVKIGAVVGGAVLAVRAVKDIIHTLGEIGDEIRLVDWEAIGDLATFLIPFVGAVTMLGGAWGTMDLAGFDIMLEGVLAIGTIITTILGFTWLDSKLIDGTLKNFSSAVESLNHIADELNTLEGKSISTWKLENIFGAMEKVFEALKPQYGQTNLGSITKTDAQNIATVFQSLSESLGYAKGALDALKTIESADFDVDTVTEKLGNYISLIGSLYGLMNENFGEEQRLHSDVGGDTVTKQGITKDAVKNVENAVAIFGHLSGVINQIKPLVDSIGQLSDIDVAMVEANMSKVSTVMKSIFTKWGEFTEGGWFKKIKNAQTDATNMQGVVDTLDNFKEVLGAVRRLMSDGVFTGDAQQTLLLNNFKFETIEPVVAEVIRVIAEVEKIPNAKFALNNITKFQEMLDGLTALFGSISGFSVDEGLTGIVEEIKAKVQEVVDALNELFEVIQEVGSVNGEGNGKVNMEIKINGKVTGADKLVRDINNAKGKIRSAVNSVPTNFTKKIYVNFSAVITGVGTVASQVRAEASKIADAVRYSSSGGYVKPVYLASGGSPWKRKGTDTVPSMLTPGEFVQRKKAVDTYGIEFMKRLNNLDLAGAMRNISSRAGKQLNGFGGVTYNIHNNNAQVVQHINHPTQDFTYRRANRYVGAL